MKQKPELIHVYSLLLHHKIQLHLELFEKMHGSILVFKAVSLSYGQPFFLSRNQGSVSGLSQGHAVKYF